MRLFKLFILGSLSSFSIPNSISYQGVLTDSNGNPVEDGSYSATFSLYDNESGGNLEWSEEQTFITVDGIFNIDLGIYNPFSNENLDFSEPLWLEIHIEGEDSPLSDRIALSSAPYSLTSENLFNGSIENSIIGAETPAAATFTSLSSNSVTIGNFKVSSNQLVATSSTLTVETINLNSNTIYIPNSVGSDYVLRSNGDGRATWSLISSGADLGQNEEIAGNWSNTLNPWQDNEVADNITVNSGTINSTDIGNINPAGATFTSLVLDSNPSDGYVLTSDNLGNATWQEASSGSGASNTFLTVIELNGGSYSGPLTAFIGTDLISLNTNDMRLRYPMAISGTVTTAFLACEDQSGSTTFSVFRDNGSDQIDYSTANINSDEEFFRLNLEAEFNTDDVLNFRMTPSLTPTTVRALVYVKHSCD